MPEKLGNGPRTGYDARVGAGLGRGPSLRKKLPAAAWSETWPAPGATLDLDFANNRGFVRGVGSGGAMDAVTFTRASNGTFVGSDGLLKTYANQGALGNNLLTFPQDFDNAGWTKTNSTVVANTEVAPDGTLTADSLFETTANNVHEISQTITNSDATSVFFAHVKSNDKRYCGLQVNNGTNAGAGAVFDLTDKVVVGYTSVGTGWSASNATITELSNGWFLLKIQVSSSGSTKKCTIEIRNSSSTAWSPIYVGSTANSIYIWGAQLEVGSSATTYYPTNINQPRFDWASTAQVAQRNLLNYTEQFDNAYWSKAQATVTANAGTAPDGTTTADKLVDNATNNNHVLFRASAATAGIQYAWSVYLKASGRTWASVGSDAANTLTYFDLSNGVLGTVGSAVTASITSVGSGWYRCSIIGNLSGNVFVTTASANGTTTYLGNGTDGILVWGAQLEVSASVTDYQSIGAYSATNTPLAANPTSNGLLIEESRANRILWCRDATKSNWTKTNVTATKDATGADGVANAATRLTATSANGTCIQTITLASGSRTGSVYLKRITGTGNIQVSLDGSTWSTVDLSSTEWRRIVLSGTVTNPVVGIRIATNGDEVAMDYAQVEDGANATSPILTTTASVTRSADTPTIQTATWLNPAKYTIVCGFNHNTVASGNPAIAEFYTSSINNRNLSLLATSGTQYRVFSDGGSVFLSAPSNSLVPNTNNIIAYSFARGASESNAVSNGTNYGNSFNSGSLMPLTSTVLNIGFGQSERISRVTIKRLFVVNNAYKREALETMTKL